MALFIKIENGQPVNHPIEENNFKACFPEIDTENLPEGWARFERVEQPELGVYEKNPTSVYAVDENGVWKDSWSVENLTEEEKTAKQNEVKAKWESADLGYTSWAWSEEDCCYVAPVPYPDDGKVYHWQESSQSWVIPEEQNSEEPDVTG
jgi:hypothetical protein